MRKVFIVASFASATLTACTLYLSDNSTREGPDAAVSGDSRHQPHPCRKPGGSHHDPRDAGPGGSVDAGHDFPDAGPGGSVDAGHGFPDAGTGVPDGGTAVQDADTDDCDPEPPGDATLPSLDAGPAFPDAYHR
jgi:hypothetical protein